MSKHTRLNLGRAFFAALAGAMALATLGPHSALADDGQPPVSQRGAPNEIPAVNDNAPNSAYVAPPRRNVPVAAVATQLRVTGEAFRPFGSSATYGYWNNGCMRVYGWTDPIDRTMSFPVQLPSGSVMTYLRMFQRDQVTAASQTTMQLVQLNSTSDSQPPTETAVVTIVSPAGLGYKNVGAGPFNLTVDYYNNSYEVRWTPSSSNQEICGMRLDYLAPVNFNMFMPITARP